MENITLSTIHKDIEFLKKAVIEIKTNMIDVDRVLDESDLLALKNYAKEKKQNRLISHEEIKKEFGL